jgi:hypothetical protein
VTGIQITVSEAAIDTQPQPGAAAMTFPLQELTRLIAPDATRGRCGGGHRTGPGARGHRARCVTARTLDALAFGDRVLIKNGMATKAPVARHIYPV